MRLKCASNDLGFTELILSPLFNTAKASELPVVDKKNAAFGFEGYSVLSSGSRGGRAPGALPICSSVC